MAARLSFIICTYNREAYIGLALQSIAAQQGVDPDWVETIVIDNNSTDSTAVVVRQFITDNPGISMRMVLETKQGLSHARNRGVQECTAEIAYFMDDDAVLSPDFAAQALAAFQNPAVDAAGGRVVPKIDGPLPAWWLPKEVYWSRFLRKLVSEVDYGPLPFVMEGKRYPFGANMGFRRSVFNQIGMFNPELGRKGTGMLGGEEKDMFDRMRQAGMQGWYLPQLVLEHIIPQARLQQAFLTRFCEGVGASERTRMAEKGSLARAKVGASLWAKMALSVPLSVWLALQGHSAAGQTTRRVARDIWRGWRG